MNKKQFAIEIRPETPQKKHKNRDIPTVDSAYHTIDYHRPFIAS